MTDPATLGQAAAGFGVLFGGLFGGWQSFKARREATRAANNAHPVSNGWGSKVVRDLDYIVASLDRAHSRLDTQDRRQASAEDRADERERANKRRTDELAVAVADAASHARTAAEQSAAVATGLAAHLADHASTDAREARPL